MIVLPLVRRLGLVQNEVKAEWGNEAGIVGMAGRGRVELGKNVYKTSLVT